MQKLIAVCHTVWAYVGRAENMEVLEPHSLEIEIMPDPIETVSTRMGDCLRAGKLSHYVTSHPGQLSLAIPPWVDAMSTGDGCGHR